MKFLQKLKRKYYLFVSYEEKVICFLYSLIVVFSVNYFLWMPVYRWFHTSKDLAPLFAFYVLLNIVFLIYLPIKLYFLHKKVIDENIFKAWIYTEYIHLSGFVLQKDGNNFHNLGRAAWRTPDIFRVEAFVNYESNWERGVGSSEKYLADRLKYERATSIVCKFDNVKVTVPMKVKFKITSQFDWPEVFAKCPIKNNELNMEDRIAMVIEKMINAEKSKIDGLVDRYQNQQIAEREMLSGALQIVDKNKEDFFSNLKITCIELDHPVVTACTGQCGLSVKKDSSI